MEQVTTDYQVKITAEVRDVINQQALECFPNECCGFLFGEEKSGRVLTLATAVINSKEGDQRRRFEISPLDYLGAEQYALSNDTQLLGIYHSHPNHPAIASEHDLAVAMPYFSYLIVSVYSDEIRDLKSWRLLDEERKFQEEKIEIENNHHNN